MADTGYDGSMTDEKSAPNRPTADDAAFRARAAIRAATWSVTSAVEHPVVAMDAASVADRVQLMGELALIG